MASRARGHASERGGETTAALDEIRPRDKPRVMDLVSEAGVDVTEWANFEGGAAKAASNPKYCYEWAFVQPGRAIVVNLWYDDVVVREGRISIALKRIGRPGLTGVRKARADKLRAAIATAAAEGTPLRVIVNDGPPAPTNGQGSRRVQVRRLDRAPWHVENFDASTGACLLYRGPGRNGSVDQFSAPEDSPERRRQTVDTFVRDPALRQRALERAGGRCEYCGQLGFALPNGKMFLETHHVVPLGEGGLDEPANIIAICPNDHREAHLGSRATEMRREMLEHLARGTKRASRTAPSNRRNG